MVGPRVAAAAAQAALQALVEDGTGLESEVEAEGQLGEKRKREGAVEAPPGPPSAVQMQAAAATALGAAAVKAKLLADQEEREIQRLVNSVVEEELARLDAKVQQFDELEVCVRPPSTHLTNVMYRVGAVEPSSQGTMRMSHCSVCREDGILPRIPPSKCRVLSLSLSLSVCRQVLLEREREQVERHRATLFTDRVALQASKLARDPHNPGPPPPPPPAAAAAAPAAPVAPVAPAGDAPMPDAPAA